jgi:methylated-DNA-[protein]-cysteine S-methyltransferase
LGLSFGQLMNSPIGPLSFAAGDLGLQGVAFMELDEYKPLFENLEENPSLFGWDTVRLLIDEINTYLAGLLREFSITIDWSNITGFQEQVLRYTYEIPYGQVFSYGEIAKQLGKPGAARAVGTALARNPIPIVIPCHRVIGSDRGLHGFGGGLNVKAFLLTLEGHTIVNNKLIS